MSASLMVCAEELGVSARQHLGPVEFSESGPRGRQVRRDLFTSRDQFQTPYEQRAEDKEIGTADLCTEFLCGQNSGPLLGGLRLQAPLVFMNRLVNAGVARNATPIGRDYVRIEKSGILRTVPTTGDQLRCEVVKHDIIVAARDALTQGQLSGGGGCGERRLVDQRDYTSPESA